MSSAKKQTPRFHVGDWVSFDYGTRKEVAEIIEDRGPLGVRGRRLYRVEVPPPDDPSGEPLRSEVPEDELAAATAPVRQAYRVSYHRQGNTNDWRATTNIEEVYRGIKFKGAVNYSTVQWGRASREDPKSARVSVLLEVDPCFGEPGFVVPDDVRREMVELARSQADEMFLSMHPRAKITHVS